MKQHKIIGGPERKAFYKKNVRPINFSENDPFWDISAKFIGVEEQIRSGKIQDVVLVYRDEYGVGMYHRGISPLTTALGMCEYAKDMLYGEIE